MPTDGFAFDLSAAEWRKNITDERVLIEVLAVRLEQALPSMTTVERNFTFFSKKKPVRSITVKLEEVEYVVTNDKSGILALRGKVVRGIRLKTEPLSFSEWLDLLSTDLQLYASQHRDTREALEQFLLGN